MVEYALQLDSTFSALSDPTRRDVLSRVSRQELSIGEIAEDYDLTFAAVSKHIKVLGKARLIVKRKRGKEQIVSAAPQALADAYEYLNEYKQLWETRLDALAIYLEEDGNE